MATKKANTSSKPKLSVSAKIDRMIEREDATVKAYASRLPYGAKRNGRLLQGKRIPHRRLCFYQRTVGENGICYG